MSASLESRPETVIPASVIIPSRNRPQMLLDTVHSILQGDTVPAEVIVVDQSDERHPTLPGLVSNVPCAVRYFWTRERGPSRARNAGVGAAQQQILVFTDDDVFVASDWLRTLTGALREAGPKAVVSGGVRLAAEQSGGFQLAVKEEATAVMYLGRIGRDVLAGLNFALYRAAFDEVSLFDERLGPATPFPGGEDNDFGYRLLEAGYRLLYVPSAVVYHRAWRTESDYLPMRWRYGLGQGAFYAKHMGLRDRYMLSRMVRDIRRRLQVFPSRVRSDRRGAFGSALFAIGLVYGATKWLLTAKKTA